MAIDALHDSFLPVRLETARLLLRPVSPDDAQVIFEGYASSPEALRFLTFPPTKSAAETASFFLAARQDWAVGNRCVYAMVLRSSGETIGTIDTRRRSAFIAEVGYAMRPQDWGKGLMAEAVKAIADRVLAHPEIYRFQAYCDVDNLASARVMEKAGMQREGLLRRYSIHPNMSSEPRDVLLYARVR